MSDWQPIGTAPKDGTPHDIWVPNASGGGARVTDVIFIPPEECPEGLGFWALEEDNEWFVASLDESSPPTHWMPRPSPPGEKP